MFGRWLTLPRDGPGLMGWLPPVADSTASACPTPAGYLPQPRRHPAAFDWKSYVAHARKFGDGPYPSDAKRRHRNSGRQ
jgi:hypothetical protein